MKPGCEHRSASEPHAAEMREGGFMYCDDCKQYVPGPDTPELCPAVSINLDVSGCVCLKGHSGGHVFARAVRGENGCAGVVFHEDGPSMSERGKQVGHIRFQLPEARPPKRAEAGALWTYLGVMWARQQAVA